MSQIPIIGRWLFTLLLLFLVGLWFFIGRTDQPTEQRYHAGTTGRESQLNDLSRVSAKPSASDVEPGKPAVPQPGGLSAGPEPDGPDAAANGAQGHPSDELIAASKLVGERWSVPDALGNRERSAIYKNDLFKYPRLRVVETWSGKSGQMESRVVMVADHLLVAPRPGVTAAVFENRIAAEGFTKSEPLGESSMMLSFNTRIDDPSELPQRIAALGELVEYAEPDYIVWPCLEPNDPAFGNNLLWGLRNPGGVSGYIAGADIDAPAGWGVRTGAGNVIVAVTDTGIRYDHQDLQPNMWVNEAEIPGNSIDDDNNGVVDDVFGYDAYSRDGDPMDVQGHGTHCAGTIGAQGNDGVGITGVAWDVQLMAGRFLGPYGGTTSDGIKVIDYAREKGAHIISASWGGGGNSMALKNAIAACANADIPFVAAAGNSGSNNDAFPHYPSSYDLPNIVAVAATNALDNLTGFSCYGRNSVDIAAPGWQIWSTYSRSTNDYAWLHGTSMATPHVSGALALTRAQFPEAGVEDLIAALYRSSDKLTSLDGLVSSGGRLNLYQLLTASGLTPLNDNFDTPFVLEGNYATWSGGNRAATREPDESSYSPAGEQRTMWFAWQAPYDGFAAVTTSSLGTGQRLVVFSGETRQSLRIITDTGTPAGAPPQTVTRFLAEAGKQYRIVTASDSAGGELFNLGMELVAANDLLSRATSLEGEIFEISVSNRGATAQPFETTAPHADVGAGHSLWFRWNAPFSGTFSINTDGSDTDSVVAVYSGDPTNPAAFTTVAANDDVDATHRWSRVVFDAVEGVSYHIAVDTAMGGTPGPIILRGASPAPPVIASEPQDLKIPIGGRAVFSIGSAGTPPLRYQWFRNDEALPGAWDATLIIDPVTQDAINSYHVVVSNSFGNATSRSALLIEKLVAPGIAWKSGDLAAAVGSSVGLGVQARGSESMTYEWRHNGNLLSGADAPSLTLSPLAVEDAGTYECRVSNAVGQASASMRVSVVASPFDAWQWRLDEIPGLAVTEMKVIDGKAYAVAGDKILVSADGLEWSAWMLPAGFEGVSLNKLGGTWLCVGMDSSSNGRCVTSTNGINWSLPQALAGLPSVTPLQHVTRIQVFNGRFIGQRASRSSIFGDVYTSTDGIAWSPATLDGTASPVVSNGPFAVGSGMMITGANSNSVPYAPTRVYSTTNGINWTALSLPTTGEVYGSSRGASRWNGNFVLFSGSLAKGWVSSDGIDWTLQSGSTWPAGGIDFNSDFVSLGGSQNDGLSVAWATDPWTAKLRSIKPATGDSITAYCSFNGRVVYGTKRGFMGAMTEETDLMPFGGTVTVPTQIAFLDNRFFVLKNSTYGERGGTPLVSGDGSTWRKMRPWTWSSENRTEAYPLAGSGGGFFWGAHESTAGPAKGLLPHVMSEFPVTNGLRNSITSLEADGNKLLAIAANKLHRSNDAGESWAEVATAPAFGSSSYKPGAAVMRSGTRWLLTNAAPTSSYEFGFVHYSDDGVNWIKTTGKAGFIVPFNGELYGLENLSTTPGNVKGWKSLNNGVSWTEVAFHATNKLANMEVRRIGVLGSSLVALVRNSSYVSSVWFSNDGISWFPAITPPGIVDFATGLGQFVGYTSTGAIVQAGAPPAGGAAPVIRTGYPVHESSVVSGSWVEVTGEAYDPEGGVLSLKCHVDGQQIGTSGAGEFHFRFRAENPAGHTVILRATDASGLVGSDELRVVVTQAQGGNLVNSAEGRDYLPHVALVEFSGAFYAMGETGIQRSTDGENWEPVILPSLSSKLKGLAAGNGTLVAQTEWGVLYSTRDGVNWVQVGLATYSGYWVTQPITFSGGHFLVIQQVAGQISTNYRTSTNGIDWKSAFVYTTAKSAMIGDNGVIVSIHENAISGHVPVWSADGGYNWMNIPGIGQTAGQSHTIAMAYGDGVFLIAASDGRVWRSTDGKSWAMANLPGAPDPGVTVRHSGGRFFVGSSTQLLYTAPATIGGTWQALSPAVKTDAVIHGAGRFIARGTTDMAWSQDGVIWKEAKGGPATPIGSRLASNGGQLLAIDSIGAAWSSTNGIVWRKTFEGVSNATDTSQQVGQQMAELGSSILLAGTKGMFLYSEDDGASWLKAAADGQPVPAAWNFNRVQVSNGVALATAAIGTTVEKVVLRSTGGKSWQTVAALATHSIVDVAGNGTGRWLAAGSVGALFRSNDNGVSWQPVETRPTMATARAVAWFNNHWVMFGAVTSGAASRCWTSPDGLVWTDRGTNGLNYSGNDFFRVESHGRLVVWNRTDRPVVSSDGIAWQPFVGYQTFVGNSLYWVAPTADGFILATPFISAQAPIQMFSGTPNGQSWLEIPRFQTDTTWAATFGDRLFLFAPGRVLEWSERDMELELVPVAMETLGVGNAIQSPAVLRNPGGEPISGLLDVDAWLSADGYFGDGNDIYVGRIQIDAPLIPPGGETAVDLSFTLPNQIKPGDSRLVVVLDPDHKMLEKNRANNISISFSAAARIPQRRLAVLAIGNGTVNSDQNAEYYPQGARIAMVANPGKGARFGGWGGDAVGSLSETLVIMDTDKDVVANFISTAVLTVFTRGGGRVEQSADDGIYMVGSTANLTAAPLPGWSFSGWSGSLSGDLTAESLLMGSNKVVTARFSLGFAAWKSQQFSAAELADPSVSGDNIDADGDGLENWREWLRGSRPKDRSDRGQSPMRREGDWIVITYTRMENLPAGHDVRCFASSNLSDWSAPLDERVVGSASGVETIEARIDVSDLPRAFMRIGDTRPGP